MTTTATPVDCADGCLLCQVLANHPRWLVAESETPPRWRFAYFTAGMYGPVDRTRVVEACKAFANRHGDAELVKAIKAAQGMTAPHGYGLRDIDAVLSDVLDGLRKRGIR